MVHQYINTSVTFYLLLFVLNMAAYLYRPQRSCGQGNVFYRCVSVHRGGGGGRVSASVHAGMPYPPGMETPPDGGPPGMENPPGWRTPPGYRLQHTVYERPVRILLECILVTFISRLFRYYWRKP